MIAVDAAGDRAEVAPAVLRQVQRAREREDLVRVLRIDTNVGVIEGAEVDIRIAIHRGPRLPGVVAPPQLSLVRRLADHVDDVRVARRDRDADAVHRLAREAAKHVGAGERVPRRAAVHRLVDPGLAAPRGEVPGPPAIGVHPGIDDVAVVRVGGDVGAGGLLVEEEHALPRGAAICRLVDAALLARPPLAPEDAGVDDVGVPRVDHDTGDLVGLLEPDALPVIAPVDRLVHPVADRGVVARIPLTRTDVDDIAVARRHRDRPDRDRPLVIEDRREGRPAVGGPDDPTVGPRHVVRERVAGNTGHHRDTPRVVDRADGAPVQARELVAQGLLSADDAAGGDGEEECDGAAGRDVHRSWERTWRHVDASPETDGSRGRASQCMPAKRCRTTLVRTNREFMHL